MQEKAGEMVGIMYQFPEIRKLIDGQNMSHIVLYNNVE